MNLLIARKRVLAALDAAADIQASETDEHMIKEMAAICDSLDEMYKRLSDLDGHVTAVPSQDFSTPLTKGDVDKIMGWMGR